MKSLSLTFPNAQGQELAAQLDRPLDQTPRAYALFAHCFTCSKNLAAVRNIARALNQAGIAVLRFDFTGLGDSEGEFADTNFTSSVDDLVAAAEFLEREYAAPALLVGHSLGGAAVLQAAGRLASVKAVATIGAPADPEHVTGLFAENREEIEREGAATVKIAGRGFRIKKQFIDDLEDTRMDGTIQSLKRALLVLHSPVDEIVGVDNARKIFVAARHPKSYISLDHADHLLSKAADSEFAGMLLGAWASKYIGDAPADDLATNRQAVVRTGDSLTTEIKTGKHRLLADEPASVGGADLGPSPYDLLVSALGACTTMTLRLYANVKKWPLDEVRVHLQHEKIHASDCADCETKDGKLDLIKREIEIFGDLDDDQRGRLLEIADKCPVHRTLSGEIKITTAMKTDGA